MWVNDSLANGAEAKISEVLSYLRRSRSFCPPERWAKVLEKAALAVQKMDA